MKYQEIITEKRIRNVSLILLLFCMTIAWYLNSSLWYNICIFIVALSFLLHGIDDYFVKQKLRRGIVTIVLSLSFAFYYLIVVVL